MGHSIRMAKEIYRTTNDADLQGTLKRSVSKRSASVDTETVLTGQIGRLGLILEEALLRLMKH